MDKQRVFFLKMNRIEYLTSFSLSAVFAAILSLILRVNYKSFGAFLFNFVVFFIFLYRAIEILITKKSIPMARLVYGNYREGKSAIIDFISYLVVIILFFIFGLINDT